MTRQTLGRLVATVVIALAAALTAIVLLAPTATCRGWLHVPPAHQGSDLHGGAVDRWYAICRLR